MVLLLSPTNQVLKFNCHAWQRWTTMVLLIFWHSSPLPYLTFNNPTKLFWILERFLLISGCWSIIIPWKQKLCKPQTFQLCADGVQRNGNVTVFCLLLCMMQRIGVESGMFVHSGERSKAFCILCVTTSKGGTNVHRLVLGEIPGSVTFTHVPMSGDLTWQYVIVNISPLFLQEFELRKQARGEGRRYCNTGALTYQAERMPEQIRLNVSLVVFLRGEWGIPPPLQFVKLSSFIQPRVHKKEKGVQWKPL